MKSNLLKLLVLLSSVQSWKLSSLRDLLWNWRLPLEVLTTENVSHGI